MKLTSSVKIRWLNNKKVSVIIELNKETLSGVSLGTKDTTHNNEVSVKWVSTVIRYLFEQCTRYSNVKFIFIEE